MFSSKKKVSVDQEMMDSAAAVATASRWTWYEWTGSTTLVAQLALILAVILGVLFGWQMWNNKQLSDKAAQVAPVALMVDPRTKSVVETITMDPKQYSVDDSAGIGFVKDFIRRCFDTDSQHTKNNDNHTWCRMHTVDQSPALTKMDAYFYENDPDTLAASGTTVDVVDIKAHPDIGKSKYTYTATWTLQPYSGNVAEPATSWSGTLELTPILPRKGDNVASDYPFLYVQNFKWGKV